MDSGDGKYIIFLCIGIIGYFTIPTVAGWISRQANREAWAVTVAT